jgi:hypothetical protein
VKAHKQYGSAKVEGQVENRSAKRLEHVAALVTWHTNGGAFVKRAEALIEYDPIMRVRSHRSRLRHQATR